MLESLWMVLFVALALAAAVQLFPTSGQKARRLAKTAFYGMALVGVVSWTLLKSIFLLAGRRLQGR